MPTATCSGCVYLFAYFPKSLFLFLNARMLKSKGLVVDLRGQNKIPILSNIGSIDCIQVRMRMRSYSWTLYPVCSGSWCHFYVFSIWPNYRCGTTHCYRIGAVCRGYPLRLGKPIK